MEVAIQRIKKDYDSLFKLAKKYYIIVFELNDIHITDKELDLVAFSAINGTISTPRLRKELVERFGMSKGYMYNVSAKLQKMNIFVKGKDKKIRVNPQIHPDFTKDNLLLIVRLSNN